MARQKLYTTVYFLFIFLCLGAGVACADQLSAIQPVVEWQLQDGTLLSSTSGALGNTGVTAEVRAVPTSYGNRYDIRLRNRTGQDYTHAALRVRLPRTAAEQNAIIEGISVPVPAEIRQWWESGPLVGAKYGFAYEIKTGQTVLKRKGLSSVQGQWGGRASGIVRIDGKAYVIPEFWERQPRKITVTSTEIILTLFEGSEPLRAGEDAWDRFVVIENISLSDSDIRADAEGLPDLTLGQRETLMERFGIAPEGLKGPDAEAETLLRKYDQWQGTSWEKRYADDNPGRWWTGEDDSTRTTLFSLFERGSYCGAPSPVIYAWRDYGDIAWADGFSDLHYDWLRSGFKHYLRTGNKDALRWAMAAMRHVVSVDHVWESPATPATNDYRNLAGLTRYEKGDHGGADFMARPTHTWLEGLFLAYQLTGDPWILEAAKDVAEGDWRFWNGSQVASWDGGYAETRVVTWPLLAQMVALRETGDQKYWQKAKELMASLLAQEQRSGGGGYITNSYPDVGNVNNAQSLMSAYSVRAMVAFADEAQKRGEWTADYQNLMKRWATWLTTPVPNGAYFPNGTYFTPPRADITYGTYAYFFCPPGKTCTQPTSTSGDAVYNPLMVDLFAWLAVNDPSGGNPNTGLSWKDLTRRMFSDGLLHAPHPYGVVGFLTNQYPGTETKALGWMQLFSDRTALWLSTGSQSCSYTISPASRTIGAAGGPGSINVSAVSGCSWTAVSNASWISIVTPGAGGADGNGLVSYSVSANASTSPRVGTITAAGQTFTVTQDGQACAYSISPASASFGASGGSGSVSVTCGTGCSWTASSNASWIGVTGGSGMTGNGSVSYSVSANNTTSTRTGSLTIAGQTHTVSQTAMACSYSISPVSDAFAAAGGTGSVGISCGTGCSWTASGNASWIGVTSGGTGSGVGTLNYSVGANSTTSSRTGTLTVAGQTFTVNQDGAPAIPAIAVSPTTVEFGVVGTYTSTTRSVTVSNTGTGNLTVSSFTISGNNGSQFTRSSSCGSVAVGGSCSVAVTFRPTSSGVKSANLNIYSNDPGRPVVTVPLYGNRPISCTYSISPIGNALTASGGAGSVSVSTSGSCGWTASSSVSWITISSGVSGTGSGTVNYSVAANMGGSRTGTITVAGQTFTVTQAAGSCTYAISPASASYDAAAQAGGIAVTAPTGCTWTASSNTSWMSLAPESTNGSGNGTVNYSVGPNATASSRTGTMTIAGQTFTVTQMGQATPVISVSPNLLNFGTIAVRTSATRIITVSNKGGTDLTVSSVTFSGFGTNQFSRTTNCGTVAPNGSCSIQVTFSPTFSGKKSANLKISSNDPSTPALGVSLTGSGK